MKNTKETKSEETREKAKQEDLLAYLERRAKELKLEEEEFRKKVLNNKIILGQ